ncbi:class I SAM-dependent methyltransferase [Lapidilactobacillus mulanensis]|uniref:Class I SAM-dependent methyltransferase n=1 Tax=Lapidilactobacillus mulanensis TaxID=2485999 RepID=A0ABW4DQ77_9LACO|nr:class I SAM-dependent methyltransferase [Lapidilactobacillus mulanensis]
MSKQIEAYYKHSYANEKPVEHEWTAGTANPELVNLVYDQTIKEGSNILEIGCGLGAESVFLAVRGMNMTSVDISQDAINTAESIAKAYQVDVDWRVGDILKMELPEHSFDVITDQGCFHHLTDEERPLYLQQIKKFLKPGGMFLLRCFSDKIPGGPQPRRITSDELLQTFYPELKLEHMELVLSFSTDQRQYPQGWYTIWYNRD